MPITRYMIVEHSTGMVDPTVHELLGAYHYESISSTHVLMYAIYPEVHHSQLCAHAKVMVLPHHNVARKPLNEYLTGVSAHKKPFIDQLASIGIDGKTHMVADLIETAVSKYGVKFEPKS